MFRTSQLLYIMYDVVPLLEKKVFIFELSQLTFDLLYIRYVEV